jgi:hypothetical protein
VVKDDHADAFVVIGFRDWLEVISDWWRETHRVEFALAHSSINELVLKDGPLYTDIPVHDLSRWPKLSSKNDLDDGA